MVGQKKEGVIVYIKHEVMRLVANPVTNPGRTSKWPEFITGFSFVLSSLLIGPNSRWYYVVTLFLFIFLTIADVLRFGEHLVDIVLYIHLFPFFHGGIVAAIVILGFRGLKLHFISKSSNT